MRLEPQDEYLHPPGPEATFNESMYFNVYDPSKRIGGFLRLGNRAHEGYAEMTVCLYLPDGRVAFMFQRPQISGNNAFDAGGLRFEVIRPFEELHVSYTGRLVLLDNPLDMADPKEAFGHNPHDDGTVQLTFSGVSTMFGGVPTKAREAAGEEFASAHYEQLTAAIGTIAVGPDRWEVHGFGLRDHSWGARSWQAPWYYRWLTANFGPTFGFMGSRVASREGPGRRGGFVWDGTALHVCQRFTVATTWSGVDSYHDTIDAVLSGGDRHWHARGRVLSLIPLRNRRDGQITRISEGMTEWRLDDGRIGYGLSEYLDQIVDGKPVGIAE
jgi:hypothetical protein